MFGCSAGLLPGAEVNGLVGGVGETVRDGVPLCGLHVCQGCYKDPASILQSPSASLSFSQSSSFLSLSLSLSSRKNDSYIYLRLPTLSLIS